MNKKILIGALILLTSTFTFFTSCKKNDQKTVNPDTNTIYKTAVLFSSAKQAYIAGMDSIGSIHNATMDTMFNALLNMYNSYYHPANDSVLVDTMKHLVNNYLISKGHDASAFITLELPSDNDTILNLEGISTGGQSLITATLSSQDSLINGDINETQFIASCQRNIGDAYVLGATERSQIGATIAVYQYSTLYWKNNSAKFNVISGNLGSGPFYPSGMTVNQRKVIGADAWGALEGAIEGIGGGPVGIALGGMFGATCCSLVGAMHVLGAFPWFDSHF